MPAFCLFSARSRARISSSVRSGSAAGLTERAERAKALATAFRPFYASLTDDQKEVANVQRLSAHGEPTVVQPGSQLGRLDVRPTLSLRLGKSHRSG